MKKIGFSLIELLVVIGILGLVLGLGLPAFSRFADNLSLQASAKTVAAELRRVQGQAYSRHETLTFKPADYQLPAGLKFTQAPEIRFTASGNPAVGKSGTLILQNRSGAIKKIIVASTGRVRLE